MASSLGHTLPRHIESRTCKGSKGSSSPVPCLQVGNTSFPAPADQTRPAMPEWATPGWSQAKVIASPGSQPVKPSLHWQQTRAAAAPRNDTSEHVPTSLDFQSVCFHLSSPECLPVSSLLVLPFPFTQLPRPSSQHQLKPTSSTGQFHFILTASLAPPDPSFTIATSIPL